jgi:hypothetical protein
VRSCLCASAAPNTELSRSRSFRDALQRIGRYKKLTCPEEIRLRTSGDEASVEFIYLQADELQPDVLVDLTLSWILALGRRGTDGQMAPPRLELARPANNCELLESHFGCRVRFKADRNALIFRKADLDRPFVTQNEELLKAIGAQLEAELQERNAEAGLAEQVKRTLKHSMSGKRPTLQQVARELCMSARTLQRRLTWNRPRPPPWFWPVFSGSSSMSPDASSLLRALTALPNRSWASASTSSLSWPPGSVGTGSSPTRCPQSAAGAE